MEINVDQKMLDLKGKEIMRRVPSLIKGEEPEKPKPLTLKAVCVDAVFANYPNEQMAGEEKLERYKLAALIDKGGMVGLSSEKIVLLKKAIARYWGTRVSGQAWIMLEKMEEQQVQTQKKKDQTEEKKEKKEAE